MLTRTIGNRWDFRQSGPMVARIRRKVCNMYEKLLKWEDDHPFLSGVVGLAVIVGLLFALCAITPNQMSGESDDYRHECQIGGIAV